MNDSLIQVSQHFRHN